MYNRHLTKAAVNKAHRSYILVLFKMLRSADDVLFGWEYRKDQQLVTFDHLSHTCCRVFTYVYLAWLTMFAVV